MDSVSGATVSSEGIVAAVADAIAKAGGDVEALKNVAIAAGEHSSKELTADVVVVGGGAGFAEFDGIGNCAELQKLYLNDAAKGKGYGKDLVQLVENTARSAGYKNLYLETHTNLSVALKLYEKMGFQQIEKPHLTQHSTMNRFYLKKL